MLSLLLPLADRRHSPAAARKPIPTSALAGDALFEALVLETHDMAADVVVLASVMNAPLPQAAHLLRACRNFVPRLAGGSQMIARARDEAAPLARSIDKLGQLIESMRGLAGSTEALLAAAGSGVPATELARLHAPCERGWRAVAVRLLDLIQMLEPETRWRLNGAYTENSLVLGRALRAVIAGEAAAIDRWGELARPHLPQRRSAPRYELDEPCIVHCRGRAVRARAIDISVGGLGVTSVPHVSLRDGVEIEIRTRLLAGTIVWKRESRVGVQLARPLAADDPMLGARA